MTTTSPPSVPPVETAPLDPHDALWLSQTPDAETGWDYALSMLNDVLDGIRTGEFARSSERSWALRDLARIEFERRDAWKRRAALGEEGAPRSGRIIPCTASAAETEWKLERSGRGDSDPASAGERLDELRTGNAPERSGRSIGSRSLLASASRDSGSEANGEENTRG